MIQEPLTSAPSGGAGTKLKVCYGAIVAAVLTQLVMMIVLLSIESSTGHWSSSGLTYCVVEVAGGMKRDQGDETGLPFSPAAFDDALDEGCTLVGGVSSRYIPSTEEHDMYKTATLYTQAMMCPKSVAVRHCLGAT
eukprot:COSAG02_NODE_9220_length_2285_cov_2.246569_1_plen_136_part_00